jgi:hypothetical protein
LHLFLPYEWLRNGDEYALGRLGAGPAGGPRGRFRPIAATTGVEAMVKRLALPPRIAELRQGRVDILPPGRADRTRSPG